MSNRRSVSLSPYVHGMPNAALDSAPSTEWRAWTQSHSKTCLRCTQADSVSALG